MWLAERSYEAQVEQHYRHNYIVNVLDGTFFWAGSSFISSATILPVYVSRLTDSKLLIGLLSMIGSMGWLLPQLFTANRVQRLPRKKPWPIRIGFFTERLPVVFLALSVLLVPHSPTWALVAFFACYTWHVVGAGLVAVAWQAMVGKVIPDDRRGKFFGLTNFLGTATGVVGAAGAAWVLDRYGFPRGYLWSFSAAAAMVLASWVALALTREPAREPEGAPISQLEYLRRLPAVLRGDQNFARYLVSQVVAALGGMAGGFLTVYALRRWDLPDGQAGAYTAAMLIGQAVSNLVFGPLADRKGHKLVLELSLLLGGAAVGLAALAPSPGWFYAVFALGGAQTAGFLLSGLMIALEFCPEPQRPTYIGLNNTVRGVAFGLAPLLGSLLASSAGYRALFAVAFAISMAALGLLRWSVHEPRQVRRAASAPAAGED
jgi:MFS family permease